MVHAFLHQFLDIWLDMAPWLLVGFVLAFLISVFPVVQVSTFSKLRILI